MLRKSAAATHETLCTLFQYQHDSKNDGETKKKTRNQRKLDAKGNCLRNKVKTDKKE